MTEDIFDQWKAEVSKLRLQHEAELANRDRMWKRRLQRAVEAEREPVGDWRNWRGT